MSTLFFIVLSIFALIFLGLTILLALRVLRLQAEKAEAIARIGFMDAQMSERKAHEEKLRIAARSEFENLAKQLIQVETREFRTTSEAGLERLLNPLKERLKDFEKRVEESYHVEGRERQSLKTEVERLIRLNELMASETSHLTQALKGDSKFQGDWGELVLERILESSGLREGAEYTKQQSFENDEGDRFRPDIVIQLPDEKQIVIDSKVSLTAYELYGRAESPEDRARHLRAHLESLTRHVNDLSEKHYAKLKGLRSPEFVFLFTPIEPAYLIAMREDPDLATRAWSRGIAIVTSTTLFTSLKTVASIWRLESQNRNAQQIAEEAAKLYDKFVGFHDDFEKVGRALESSLDVYEDARRKLREGPGNIYRKIEVLRELGAAPSKRIKPELLE